MATKTPPGSPQGQPDPQPSTPTTPAAQPSPPIHPTPPLTPQRGPIRDRWSLLTGLLIGAVAVIVVWILVANHVFTGSLVSDSNPARPPDSVQTTAPAIPSATATGGSPTSTPTDSASSPFATASAGAGVSTGGSSTPTSAAACNTAPTVPQQSLAVTLPQPAGSTEARSELQQIAGAGYKTVFYTGEPKSATIVNQWMSDVQCTGMASALQVDNVFNQSGDGGKTFVAAVQGHADLKAFVVSMNGVPDGTSEAGNPSAVNSRVAAIKSQTGKPVWCELNFMTFSQASAYSSCDRHIIGYFPWKNSVKYGPVSALKDVGSLTKQLDGAGATVGVQAFDWWTSEPATAQDLGFTQNNAGLPAPTDVRDMAKLAKDHGSVNVLVVSEEPAADNVTYLVAIGNACRPTCICTPQGS